MKRLAIILALATLQICAHAQTAAPRPRILGIDHVSFYTTAPDGVRRLYADVLGLPAATPVESGGLVRYMVGEQWVGYSAAPDPKATDRMDHVAFSTDNIIALRKYLIAQGIKVPQIQGRSDHSLFFVANDPEGHRIEFVERDKGAATPPAASAVSRHMIHTGFVVYHRDAEDHFYRDILGFRPYWHGGMKDNETDWVALQVPDGTDWLEYMLNQPEHMDLQLTGVMNHISLGVADMKKAQAIMESHGWKPHGDEQAEIGKDGKWQLDVFDLDLTRVELMEFKPVQKPCCSDFTGPHPSE
ncbi:MAG TPA: VOC family protein [Candidatus Sulfotelmatobacter sp.]|nr:VOC family protein [Candidatus Sulfotelmatobacter sp.]